MLNDKIEMLKQDLIQKGIRVKIDDRDYLRNGAKYFEWERKGVPLRIEIGPRDLEKNSCVFKYRAGPSSEEKQFVDLSEAASYPGKGLYLVPWKCDAANEDAIKTECKATIRCYPLEANANPEDLEGKKCFYSGEDATHMALFGR